MNETPQSNGEIGVLFVCLGNICRSPAAEGTFRHLVKEKNLTHLFRIDSSGTGAYHVGESPNPKASRAAQEHGIRLVHSARQFTREDFSNFDYILTMDAENYRNVVRMARTDEERSRVLMFRSFDPESGSQKAPDVPDPYYGGQEGFRNVQEIMNRTVSPLLDWILTDRTRPD